MHINYHKCPIERKRDVRYRAFFLQLLVILPYFSCWNWRMDNLFIWLRLIQTNSSFFLSTTVYRNWNINTWKTSYIWPDLYANADFPPLVLNITFTSSMSWQKPFVSSDRSSFVPFSSKILRKVSIKPSTRMPSVLSKRGLQPAKTWNNVLKLRL